MLSQAPPFDAGYGISCIAAGGTCVAPGVDCATLGTGVEQDCNGLIGQVCCLALQSAGADAGDAAAPTDGAIDASDGASE
jgi:hypothetical protein